MDPGTPSLDTCTMRQSLDGIAGGTHWKNQVLGEGGIARLHRIGRMRAHDTAKSYTITQDRVTLMHFLLSHAILIQQNPFSTRT